MILLTVKSVKTLPMPRVTASVWASGEQNQFRFASRRGRHESLINFSGTVEPAPDDRQARSIDGIRNDRGKPMRSN